MAFWSRKKAAEIKQSLAKVEKREVMRGIIGGRLLVAYADGECSTEEMANLQKAIGSDPQLKAFGAELGATIDEFCDILEAGFRMGRITILREIAKCKAIQTEAEDILVNAITGAEAGDGEIGADERKALEDIAKELGLNVDRYL